MDRDSGYIMLGPADIKMEPIDIKVEPVDIKQEMDPDSIMGRAPKIKGQPKKLKQEKITDHVTVKKRKVDRFKGMPEEEVAKRLLPDHLAPNLDIVIVGINPGLYAAFVGHHYAGPGNHFWKCMYLSGLIPEPMNAMQDFKLLEYGIGFTNIVARTTRGSADLTKKEIKEGAQLLTEKLLQYKPKIAVFNGKGIYEIFVGHKNFHFGKQPEPLPGTETAVYVMPSSSARCSQLPRAVDKVPFYEALKKFRDHLTGKLPNLQESEITFPDLALKTAVKKEPKVENLEDYPGELDSMSQFSHQGSMDSADQFLSGFEQQLSQFSSGSYQVIPHTSGMPGMGSSQSTYPQQNDFSHNHQHQNHHYLQQHQQQSQKQTSYSPAISSQSFREPVYSSEQEMRNGNLPSHDGGQIRVKQEAVERDADMQSCSNNHTHSETISLGQIEVYSQANATHSDSHMNNFLNGLYGMVNQVAGSQSSQSKYGLVTHSSITQGGPVQFNDALRDIVREGSTEDDFDLGPGLSSSSSSNNFGKNSAEGSPQGVKETKSSKGKASKTSKPRKRKSKSNESFDDEEAVNSPPVQQNVLPPPLSQSSTSPSLHQMTSAHTLPSFLPYSSQIPYMTNPMMAYANASYMSQMSAMQSMYMPHSGFQSSINSNTQGYPQMFTNGYQPFMGMAGYSSFGNNGGGYGGNHGQDGTGIPSVPAIKQEKPDY
ncbi:uncharacterized protein LOC127858140 isoform X1 [Dreissena polymorpha]|uniref:G/T mismatch-specific thymine DNA glycosylase n=1 Tax=Dreissena polymorpha TaxID=45954 RepID=A0A9D4NGA9_DREPO|nr:uncharacterized protein LOC127858140 isoform X1 [Dreissena polymorpha]XP_052251071.1 uncharacterized protein LOC127858140 isoform X1 [Dreissena polymorpha]KAH3892677.1 hypothetical protein DPMN_016801 [Dreissena polymorpha]